MQRRAALGPLSRILMCEEFGDAERMKLDLSIADGWWV